MKHKQYRDERVTQTSLSSRDYPKSREGIHRLLLVYMVLLLMAATTVPALAAPRAGDEREKTVLVTILSPLTVGVEQHGEVAASLVDGYGQPVVDLPVTLYIDNVEQGRVDSDVQGRVFFQLPPLAAGEHGLSIMVKGKHGYRSATTLATLSVAPPAVVQEAANASTTTPSRMDTSNIETSSTDISSIDVSNTDTSSTDTSSTNTSSIDASSADAEIRRPSVDVVSRIGTLWLARIRTNQQDATTPPANSSSTEQETSSVELPVGAPSDQNVQPASVVPPTAQSSTLNPPQQNGPSWMMGIGSGFLAGIAVMLLIFWAIRRLLRTPLVRSLLRWRGNGAKVRSLSNFQRIIVDHIATVKWSLLLAVLSMVGRAITDLLNPWPLKIIFDYILIKQSLPERFAFLNTWFGADTLSLLGVVAGSIVLLALLKSALSYAETYITARAGYQLVNTLRRELFLHFQRLSLTFHNESKRGELLFNVARDSQTLRDAFTDSALSLITQVVTMVGMFAIMFWVNWRLSLIPLLTFPMLFFAYSHLQHKLKKSVRKQREKEGKIANQLTENLSIMPVIQAFGRERYEAERFEVENSHNLESGIQIARMSAALNRTMTIISEGGLALVVFIGAWMALRGSISPGDMLLFISYVRMMYKPIRQMVKMTTKLNSARVAAGRIAAVLDIDPAVQDKPDAMVAPRLQGEICFENVAFHYKPEQPVLRDLSFKVMPGQRVALVGASGAGKSTIANLLLRLYDPYAGSIYIDGVDLREYQRESLRHQIGLVLQDAFLFGATIRENICYGKPDATLAEVEEAARQAHIHDFITTLPNGYETIIGEMGSTLSGGQRQRLAIARALVKQPSILILDEPTSALDAESKALVDDTINRLQQGKTVIVIAHQLSSIRDADQIFVMAQGEIVERGTHDELLEQQGVYADLYQLQNGIPVSFDELTADASSAEMALPVLA